MTGPIVERWLNRFKPSTPSQSRTQAPAPSQVAAPAAADERIELDFPGNVAREFPDEFAIAWPVVEQVLSAIDGVDLSPLARRSPALAGFDWTGYLRLSVARVVRALRALHAHVVSGGRILDYGSYFGNFAVPVAEMGFVVDAVDSYAAYDGALDSCLKLQRARGVRVLDFASEGYGLNTIDDGSYDAVLCMGVIEHVPHTPRVLLEAINRVLKAGGVLILDTPNLGYLYKRLSLLEGRTIFAPIEQQYHTEVPFEGHHREYTLSEVDWMLQAAGHRVMSVETFNYSMFGQTALVGEHVEYAREMDARPDLRELIFVVSRRG